MALTVGQLRVQLEARTQAFRRGIIAAQTQVRTFATRSRAALATVGRAFSGLRANIGTLTAGTGVIGALGAALVAATRAAAGSVDEIAKSARQANVTAEEFQRLTFAAEEAGVETRGFANSLLLFNRNIGEAITGIGPGAEAFEALGVEIRNTDGTLKSVEQLFGETADALEQVPAGAQRAQLAFDLFGRQGAKLAPLLAQGSARIREAGDEGQRLGLIFSNDVVANAELVNDAFGRLSRAVDVQVKSALIELAPELLELAGGLLPQLITGIRVVVGAFGILQGILASVQAFVVAFLSPITFLIRTFIDLVAVATQVGDVIEAVFSGDFGRAAEAAKQLGADFGSRVVKNIRDGFEDIKAATDTATQAFGNFSQTDESLAKVGARFEAVGQNSAEFARRLRDGSAAAAQALEDADRLSSAGIVGPDAQAQITEDVSAAVIAGLDTDGKEDALSDLGSEVGEALDVAIEENALPGVGETLASGIGDGFTAALEGGGAQGFLQNFSTSLQTSSQEALDRAFAESVNSLGQLLEGALGGLGGEGLSGIISGAVGIAGSLIAAGLQEDNVQASAANVSSAITSSQQVRGIAAGPTSIGIAQVQRGIQEAFVEPTRLLRLIARSNDAIAANTGGASGTTSFGLGDDAADALANESPSLV